jgi:hypothetical protein
MVDELNGCGGEDDSADDAGEPEVPIRPPEAHTAIGNDAEHERDDPSRGTVAPQGKTWNTLKEQLQRTIRWLDNNNGAVTAIATAVIAATTIAYTHYARKQWRVMDRQLAELKREQRPILEVESFFPQDFPDGANPSFTLVLRNYGHDMATGIYGNTTMTVSSAPITWDWNAMVYNDFFHLPISPNGPIPRLDSQGNFTLPPIPGGATKNRWVATESDWPQHKTAVKAGTEFFYFWGVFSYNEAEEPVPFCFTYNPNPTRPTGLGPFDLCTPEKPYQHR